MSAHCLMFILQMAVNTVLWLTSFYDATAWPQSSLVYRSVVFLNVLNTLHHIVCVAFDRAYIAGLCMSTISTVAKLCLARTRACIIAWSCLCAQDFLFQSMGLSVLVAFAPMTATTGALGCALAMTIPPYMLWVRMPVYATFLWGMRQKDPRKRELGMVLATTLSGVETLCMCRVAQSNMRHAEFIRLTEWFGADTGFFGLGANTLAERDKVVAPFVST